MKPLPNVTTPWWNRLCGRWWWPGDQGWAHLGAGVGDGLAGAVVEVDRVDGAVDGGARVAAGAGAGDQGPGRGPGAVTAAPGHRGPRHHVAGPGPARG